MLISQIHTTTFNRQEEEDEDGPKKKAKNRDETQDRRQEIDVETSIRYLKSKGNEKYPQNGCLYK